MRNSFKKITYLLAITFFTLAANLTPLQAARLVPGTVPDKVPLQPMPPDAFPNYSGSIDSHTTDQEEAAVPNDNDSSQPQPDETDSVNTPALSKSPINTSTQVMIWLGALVMSAILATLWYFLRTKATKPKQEDDSVFKFKK